jgi:hypothetical protein
MATINYETRIKNLVKKSPNRSLAISELQKLISEQGSSISIPLLKTTIRQMIEVDRNLSKEKKKRKYYLSFNKGGNGVRYIGAGEIVKKGSGPYRDIANVIDRESLTVRHIFGAEHMNSFDIHSGKSARGKWGRPDMLVALYRSPGKSREYSIHTIEFESFGGFSASNVAQAYYSGRGANKSWLLIDVRDFPRNKRSRDAMPDFKSILAFAEELGVGIVTYRILSSSLTWHVELEAKNRKRDALSRRGLKALYEGQK